MIELDSFIQKGSTHLEMKWSDGFVQVLCLSDIQKMCPCAFCQQTQGKKINPKVTAAWIHSVGNYGLQIKFTEGCSKGIYPYSLLREIGI